MRYSCVDLVLAGRKVMLFADEADTVWREYNPRIAALEPLVAWARANLRDDAVVVDAGANIGMTALMLATIVPNGHVHAFEALPANVRFLQMNLERNGITNCTVNGVALGSRPGHVLMAADGACSHVAAYNPRVPQVASATTLPMTTLDTYVAEHGIGRVDFMKVDVEGFEPAVLAGAQRLIERDRMPIFMEFNTWCLSYLQNYSARNFAVALWSAFDVMRVNEHGAEQPAASEVIAFLANNLFHTHVDDLLLRMRPDTPVPAFEVCTSWNSQLADVV